MPARQKQPNHQLATLLDEAHMSNKGLAARVVRLGSLRGAPDLRYDHTAVIRWRNGEHPREPVPEIIAEVLTVELGRRVTVADIGMRKPEISARTGLELPTSQPAVVEAATLLWKADVDQQRSIVESRFDPATFSAAALRWLIGPWEPAPFSATGRRIGAAEVDEIRQLTSAFQVLDNRLGGGHVRVTVIEYLHTQVGPMLREARCAEPVRRQLFSAAAELTKLAAWINHDLDRQGLAQRYLVQALAMSRFAGDYGLSGEILAAMSQQAHYIAQASQAVDVARAAQAVAKRAALPILMTECHVMEAHGYAAMSDARACGLALKRAESSYDRATATALPPWLEYFDEAYFAAKIAHCFRDLDRPKETERYALQSLNMDPGYRRGKTFNTAVLAMAQASQGRLDEACTHGRTAVDMAAGLTSVRVYRYIRDVVRALGPYDGDPMVGEFMSYAEERLPALRVRGERP